SDKQPSKPTQVSKSFTTNAAKESNISKPTHSLKESDIQHPTSKHASAEQYPKQTHISKSSYQKPTPTFQKVSSAKTSDKGHQKTESRSSSKTNAQQIIEQTSTPQKTMSQNSAKTSANNHIPTQESASKTSLVNKNMYKTRSFIHSSATLQDNAQKYLQTHSVKVTAPTKETTLTPTLLDNISKASSPPGTKVTVSLLSTGERNNFRPSITTTPLNEPSLTETTSPQTLTPKSLYWPSTTTYFTKTYLSEIALETTSLTKTSNDRLNPTLSTTVSKATAFTETPPFLDKVITETTPKITIETKATSTMTAPTPFSDKTITETTPPKITPTQFLGTTTPPKITTPQFLGKQTTEATLANTEITKPTLTDATNLPISTVITFAKTTTPFLTDATNLTTSMTTCLYTSLTTNLISKNIYITSLTSLGFSTLRGSKTAELLTTSTNSNPETTNHPLKPSTTSMFVTSTKPRHHKTHDTNDDPPPPKKVTKTKDKPYIPVITANSVGMTVKLISSLSWDTICSDSDIPALFANVFPNEIVNAVFKSTNVKISPPDKITVIQLLRQPDNSGAVYMKVPQTEYDAIKNVLSDKKSPFYQNKNSQCRKLVDPKSPILMEDNSMANAQSEDVNNQLNGPSNSSIGAVIVIAVCGSTLLYAGLTALVVRAYRRSKNRAPAARQDGYDT
ncbi:5099_t:CDS:2, partial [Cetraspora pellucida]